MSKYVFTTEFQTGWRFPINRRKSSYTFIGNWMKLEAKDGYAQLTVPAGYSWDGCSPKFAMFGRHWGTPDFEFTRRASLIHDALYQFAGRHVLCRSECDYAFLHAMVHRQDSVPKFWQLAVAVVYYTAVRAFGWYFWSKRQK